MVKIEEMIKQIMDGLNTIEIEYGTYCLYEAMRRKNASHSLIKITGTRIEC